MQLIINSTTPQDSRVILLKKSRVFAKKVPFRNGKRGDILSVIDSLLVSKKSKIQEVKGIVVVTGPGHFSYLRTGISIANALGWVLGIPVVGLTTNQFLSDRDLIEKGIALVKKTKAFKPVLPVYGKEPNITIKRNS